MLADPANQEKILNARLDKVKGEVKDYVEKWFAGTKEDEDKQLRK